MTKQQKKLEMEKSQLLSLVAEEQRTAARVRKEREARKALQQAMLMVRDEEAQKLAQDAVDAQLEVENVWAAMLEVDKMERRRQQERVAMAEKMAA